MRIDQPSSKLKLQPHVTMPVNGDATIMDDTVVIMDSPTALMGGLTSIETAMQQTIVKTVPRSTIKIQH